MSSDLREDLALLRPVAKKRLYDLLCEAGVDVSDWSNYAGGKRSPAANPKFCYNWSFEVPGRFVVLNVWHSGLKVAGGRIVLRDNLRADARRYAATNQSNWRARAEAFDLHVSSAARQALPVRVIICDGEIRRRKGARLSRVTGRMLDPAPWVVTHYDGDNGDFEIAREAKPNDVVDQFEVPEGHENPTETTRSESRRFVRDPLVRKSVLERSRGLCEWCRQSGFVMDNGRVFLETHHVVPLSEGGRDTAENVVALCANHHREAHHGALQGVMRSQLLARFADGVRMRKIGR